MYSKIYHFLFGEIAFLEYRDKYRDNRDEILFINKNYLVNKFKTDRSKITNFKNDNYSFSDSITNAKTDYVRFEELETILNNNKIDSILIDVLNSNNSYEAVNIIFPFISCRMNVSKINLNQILKLALNSWFIKKSWWAQYQMLDFIVNNKINIESDLFQKIVTEFPHINQRP
jgi:hypothetical protein